MILSTMVSKTKSMAVTLLIALSLFTVSCGENGSNIEIPGVDGPKVTLHEDQVLISMIFENLVVDGGFRYAIPKYNESYVEIGPDLQSGGTLFAASLSLQDVLDGRVQSLPPQTLPGGRALPGVKSGKLPAVAFSIEKFKNSAVYVGPEVFGIFVPQKLNMPNSIATFRYFIGSKRAGNISLVGEDQNGENSGILLLLDMNSQTKSMLKKIQKQYR